MYSIVNNVNNMIMILDLQIFILNVFIWLLPMGKAIYRAISKSQEAQDYEPSTVNGSDKRRLPSPDFHELRHSEP